MNVLKNMIVIEGLDGAGTTTQAKLLASGWVNGFFTFEPSDNFIGKNIRSVLRGELSCSKRSLAYLFAADREEHLYGTGGVAERCGNGMVFCDRYVLSSLAYQSLDNDFDFIYDLNKNFPVPEVTFFINTPIDICLKRTGDRAQLELFESAKLQERILSNYKRAIDLYRKNGAVIIEIDGAKSIDEVYDEELIILKK